MIRRTGLEHREDGEGARAKGKGKTGKGERERPQGRDDSKENGGWCAEMGHSASECSKKTAYLNGKGKNIIHQVEECEQK